MKIGRFQLKVWPTVGTVVGLCLLLGLGIWQTRRYLHKKSIEEMQAERAEQPPLELRSLEDLRTHAVNYRSAVAHGQVDAQTNVVIKHRSYNGDPGMWVLQPLQLRNDGSRLWLNRGWIPFKNAEQRVAHLPKLGDGPYRGLVYERNPVIADEDMRAKLQSDEAAVPGQTTWWDTFDLTAAYDALDGPTPDRALVLVLAEQHGGPRYPIASTQHISEPYLTSGRHLSYAVFWYTVALALVAMYVANGLGVLTSGDRELRPRNRA